MYNNFGHTYYEINGAVELNLMIAGIAYSIDVPPKLHYCVGLSYLTNKLIIICYVPVTFAIVAGRRE